MSAACPWCGGPLVHARRRDVVYEVTGRFSTMAYLFPKVHCPKCARDLAEGEWPAELRARFRSFRVKYVLFAIGLAGVVTWLLLARRIADWLRATG